MTHKIWGVHVEEYAYYVNKLRQNVGLETWKWRQIVTSQTAHTKCKWPPYDPEPNPPNENFLRTPLDITCHVPHIFRFRFRNILVSYQAVPLTFYNKIALMAVSCKTCLSCLSGSSSVLLYCGYSFTMFIWLMTAFYRTVSWERSNLDQWINQAPNLG